MVLTHTPTGITSSYDGRSQSYNKEKAFQVLQKRVEEFYQTGQQEEQNNTRTDQIGYGMRSEKIRTIHIKDNWVRCEVTNKKIDWKSYSKGNLDKLV